MLKYALNIGAITGVAIVLIKLLAFTLDMHESMIFEVLSYVALIGGMIYGIKSYREGALNGYIAYERSLGLGTLIAVGASLVFAFFLYFYFTMIDGSVIDKMFEAAKEELYNDDSLSDEEIDTALQALPMFLGPGFISITSFIVLAFIGLVFSAIVSIFMKKPEPLFPEEQE